MGRKVILFFATWEWCDIDAPFVKILSDRSPLIPAGVVSFGIKDAERGLLPRYLLMAEGSLR